MKKRIFITACSIMLSFASVTGCFPCNLTNQTATVAEAATKKANAKKKAPSASILATAVKKAYGKNYVPNYKLSADEIKNLTGISQSWCSSFYAEQPMISVHIDTLMIFKAKNAASKKKVLEKVKAYRKYLMEDTMQYPSNQYKINGSTIYTKDNYVCFIMLGQIDQSVLESDDEAAIIKAYKSQNQKAVTTIKNKLKGK